MSLHAGTGRGPGHINRLPQGAGSGSPVLIPAPFASVNGPTQGPSAGPYEAWSAEYAGTPVVANPDGLTPTTFNVTRQGYDATGAAISNIVDLFTVTSRVRQPYPNQAGSPQPHTVALSDYIYSTDTVAGTATNNSTFISPKPVCNWVSPHRLTVGNTLNIEVEAFHRNARAGKQVACVIFTATDAHSHTATQTVSTATISGRARDQAPVIVYAGALDITDLTDGDLITVNAKAYPWIGAAASVMDSSDGTWTALKDFSPRYFLKNVSLAASPKIIYLALAGATPAGNNATAVLSTNDTTARANPALTMAGAMVVIKNAGVCDGVQIRLQAGAFDLGDTGANTLPQNVGCITVTRDPTCPLTGAGSATLNFGSGSFGGMQNSGFTSPITTGAWRITDIQVVRTAAQAIGGAANRTEIFWDNIPLDLGAFTATWLSTADDYMYGVTMTNAGAGGALNASSAGQHRIFRGVTCDSPGSVSRQTITGSKFTNANGLVNLNGQGDDGIVVSFNVLDGLNSTNWISISTPDVTHGIAIVQNVLTFTSSTANYQLGISNDSNTNNTTHVIIHNNTFAGSWIYGRHNIFYDEGPTERINKLQSCIGNIFVAVYTKGDVFATDGARLGNWGFLYGVGSQGQFTQYESNGLLGTDQAQAYAGLGASNGTGNTNAAINDPKFTTFKGTTWDGTTATAGSSGGVYTVAGNSPCKGMVANAVLPFDLAGTARPTTADTTGAYA